MKKHILHFVLISGALLFTLFGCGTDTPGVQGTKYEIATDQYTFYADLEKYKEASARRAGEDECKFTWKVVKVNRDGNVLNIDISRPKDCEVKYELIWDGVLFLSAPMMANVFLKTQSEGCSNHAETIIEKLTIDLETAFKDTDPSNLSNTNFNIREFCSSKDIACSKDCNVVSSN